MLSAEDILKAYTKEEAGILNAYYEAESHRAQAEHNRIKAEREAGFLAGDLRKQTQDALNHEFYMAQNAVNRVLDFPVEVCDESVEQSIGILSRWARMSGEPITVRFTSPGGSMTAGFALYDFLGEIRAEGIKVITSALGMAASMASVLLQAGTERVIGPSTTVLIHEVSFRAGGSIGGVEDTVAWAKTLNKRAFEILAERSTLSYDEISNRAARKDWWMTAQEAVELGFADRVGHAIAPKQRLKVA